MAFSQDSQLPKQIDESLEHMLCLEPLHYQNNLWLLSIVIFRIAHFVRKVEVKDWTLFLITFLSTWHHRHAVDDVLEQLLQASNEHRSGKERFEAVDPSAALAEARRRFLVQMS